MKRSLRNRLAVAGLAFALPLSALADVSGTPTLSANANLNLDTGVIGAGPGGDILWTGTALTLQVSAKAFVIGQAGSIAGFNKSFLDTLKGAASNAAIPSASLPLGTVLAVFTNGGNTAAVLVTASGNSLGLQFNTYSSSSGGGGGSGPSITSVTNNSSNVPVGFPNSGIAQGSLFAVKGTGLANGGDASLHSSEGSGLQASLNGASVSVTVGSITKPAALYYATPTQIVGVLPSSTPIGAGTLTVTYNGTPSAQFNVQVVAAAPGITTYNGSAVAQHAQVTPNTLVTYTDSAKPGEIIIIWGTGFGATANSDTTYDASGNQTSVPYTIYIGGVAANVGYKGASVYPGVGVLGLTIPANVPTGCFIPIAAVATNGNVVSNTATIPIAANGGACSDPQLGFSGNQISTLNGTGTVKNGFLIVTQSTTPGTGTSNTAAAIFQQSTTVSASGGGTVSIGSCVISQTTTNATIGTTTGLGAGTITVTGPGGSPVTLNGVQQVPGNYFATVPSIPSTGGAYVFNATAGSQVGAFTATVNFPNPLLSWTNQNTSAAVTRTQGLNVTWSGGAPGTYVTISGSSVSGTASGGYTCIAPQSAGSFTVPSYILLGLPAGSGTTTVTNSTNFSTFSATGLDFGGALGSVSFTMNSSYN